LIRLRTALLGVAGVVAAAGAMALACGPTGFPSDTVVASVRILASRSDQPYARPGAVVHSEVLAVDGRPAASSNEPMRVFWLPFVCINPPNNAFYACFSQFEQNSAGVAQAGGAGVGGQTGTSATISTAISAWDGGAEAGVGGGLALSFGDGGTSGGLDGGLLARIPPGTDLSPFLVQGPRAVFNLPANIVSSHVPVKGATPFGLAVAFNIACAGHVELVPLDPNNANPEQIPFGCFNAQHEQLGADQYVIGYTQVFAYTSLTDTNPVISSFSYQGKLVPLDGGVAAPITVAHCGGSANGCPDAGVAVGVPDASWQPDPQDPGPDGGPLGEQIWVDYYATIGNLTEGAVLIFDPVEGRIVTPPRQEEIQTDAGGQNGTMWAVVHDNRGGAAWITVPVHSQ
jgi:hypothetical protein